jgi:hypothetical protein
MIAIRWSINPGFLAGESQCFCDSFSSTNQKESWDAVLPSWYVPTYVSIVFPYAQISYLEPAGPFNSSMRL